MNNFVFTIRSDYRLQDHDKISAGLLIAENSMKKWKVIIFFAAILFTGALSAQPDFGGKRTNLTIAGHAAFVIGPLHAVPGGRRPWAWYAPTLGNDYPDSSNRWLFEQLIAWGFWVCGIDIGQSYGSPTGQTVFSAFYDTLTQRYGLDRKVCLIAQSRGGLMHFNWAGAPGNSEKISRIAAVFPVCNLRDFPGLPAAAYAYGIPYDSLVAHVRDYNPIDLLLPLIKARVPLFLIHGDRDQVVPLDRHSKILIDRYRTLGGDATLVVVPGQGHAATAAFFRSEAMLDFLLEELCR